MVDQAELFRIADEILADGRNPTVRALQTELSKGGSFSDVGPMFKGWSLSRGFRPRPTKDDVPPAMLDSLSKVAAQIWSHGRDQGRNFKLNEHDELVEKFDAVKMAYVAAMARVKALEERLGIAGNETESDGEETNAVPGRRGAAIAFWEGLLRKVADRMGSQHLKPDIAYLLLKPEDHREAEEWSKNRTWSAAVLGDKMEGRAKKGKLFEQVGEGLYKVLAKDVEATLDEPAPVEGPNRSPEQPEKSPAISQAVTTVESAVSPLSGSEKESTRRPKPRRPSHPRSPAVRRSGHWPDARPTIPTTTRTPLRGPSSP
ncbi:DNA-binding protein [Lichenifustis flavocetrariae]|uniref:DNA-binding protein n=1 Tax=Lichenifustis flavocetrariae TaxID=2949735 RepID=A0AA41Z3D8_9HYPH|nr:DNA-binding protein [Lichenifustis flavocetrariae]MCW6512060.1 DNA-binding protein [Lichenifustis flavocetrariae]